MHPIQKQIPVSKHNLKQLKHQEKKKKKDYDKGNTLILLSVLSLV